MEYICKKAYIVKIRFLVFKKIYFIYGKINHKKLYNREYIL